MLDPDNMRATGERFSVLGFCGTSSGGLGDVPRNWGLRIRGLLVISTLLS